MISEPYKLYYAVTATHLPINKEDKYKGKVLHVIEVNGSEVKDIAGGRDLSELASTLAHYALQEFKSKYETIDTVSPIYEPKFYFGAKCPVSHMVDGSTRWRVKSLGNMKIRQLEKLVIDPLST